ncbi:MAG TPA: CSLREA domain-containing protein, partial [Thermoanaerobaculia bacterium]|nr:CSLREA domain-containing protein [Thermoanaerobaculia bacterium]
MRRRISSAFLLLVPASLLANTITVNSVLDTPANDGTCTLREAIVAANTNTASGAAAGECAAGAAGADTINFAISGAGLHTIILVSTGLPAITESVTIDGFTQPGSSANTNAAGALNAVYTIAIDGSGAGGTSAIFTTIGGSSTFRGLVVNRGALQGQSGFSIGSSGNHIEGCYIGPDATGTLANFPNNNGVLIVGGTGNVIGGTTAAQRNLISANGFDNISLTLGS